MNLNLILEHYQESQSAFEQLWNFLSRTYLIMRKLNPLLGDGLAVFAGIIALLALLETVTLLSHLFSEKYVTALCSFPKGAYKLMRWILYQIRETLNLAILLWRTVRRLVKKEEIVISPTEVFTPGAIAAPSNSTVTSLVAIDKRAEWAIEARTLLRQVLETDSRHRNDMRRLISKAAFRLEMLGLPGNWFTLVDKARVETKGTVIKQYAQRILDIAEL